MENNLHRDRLNLDHTRPNIELVIAIFKYYTVFKLHVARLNTFELSCAHTHPHTPPRPPPHTHTRVRATITTKNVHKKVHENVVTGAKFKTQ